jgi:hypothetical protein
MLKTKQFFDKYVDEITRFQYKNLNPISTLNVNAENTKTRFKLDHEDDLFLKIFYTILQEKSAR